MLSSIFALGFIILTSALSANNPIVKLVFCNPMEASGISFVINSSSIAETYTETANKGQLN